MYLNYRGTVRIIGALFALFGILFLFPAACSVIYHEWNIAATFAGCSVPLIVFGAILYKRFSPSNAPYRVRDGFLIVTLCWVVASMIGALPFIFTGICNVTDAFFEASSGLTTTGSTILSGLEDLPKGILFWRCFTHWIGGLGILFMVMAILPALGIDGHSLASSELTGPTLDKIVPKLTDNARIMYIIYIAFTVTETILLLMCGMSPFDAITHAFSTMGTGGFSNYDASLAYFDSPRIEFVIIIYMFLASLSFNLYYYAYLRGIRVFLFDAEFKTFVFIVFSAIFAISFYLSYTHYYTPEDTVRHAAFNVLSIISSTGFTTVNFDAWPAFARSVILALMFCGACAGSTGGGVKVIRILVTLKLIKRGIQMRLHPNAVVRVRLGGKELPANVIMSITSFVVTYIFILFAGTVIVSFDGWDFTTSFSSVLVSIGNIGPGFSGISPVGSYNIFSAPVKLFLSALMIFGRLEIFPAAILLSRHFWNPNR